MADRTMRAVRFHEYGPPEVLVVDEVPRPRPGQDQVLVRVHAAGVNPIDWKLRSGMVRQYMPLQLPHIPGVDLAGTVEELGPGVNGMKIGQAVYGRGNGTYAEYAVADVSSIAPKPSAVSFVEAGGIPVGAGTAWACLFDAAEVREGQRLLVHGAAGGVGTWVVQLAHWKGAHVTGTASAVNLDFVRALGADAVIDYTSSRFEDEAHDLDAVIDTVGGDLQARSLPVLRRGGIFVEIAGPVDEDRARELGVRVAAVNAGPARGPLEAVAALLDSGAVRTEVGRVFPLGEAAAAQALSQTGHGRGRIVLEVATG